MLRDPDALERLRQVGDEDADRLIRVLFDMMESSEGSDPVRTLMGSLIAEDEVPPSAFPPQLRAFLEERLGPPPGLRPVSGKGSKQTR